MRDIFSAYRNIQLAVSWYGSNYKFERDVLDSRNEPTGETEFVQMIPGIYHASAHDFVALVPSDGGTVKEKINKGIICGKAEKPAVKQNDKVEINGVTFHVTALEPILFGGEPIAWEISIEELIKG